MFIVLAGIGLVGWISYRYHILNYAAKLMRYGFSNTTVTNKPAGTKMRMPSSITSESNINNNFLDVI